MSPYTLHCLVCESNFSRSDDWANHLFESYHQDKARLECVDWNDMRKECALVAFFSCPISSSVSEEMKISGKCDEEKLPLLLRNYLLMTLSGKEAFKGALLLTDFVMWNEQPKMCVLQLESRDVVNLVYTRLVKGENGVQKQHEIGKHLVQFKKLTDLLELEWRVLIPGTSQNQLKRRYATDDETCPQPKRGRIHSDNALDGYAIPFKTNKSIGKSNMQGLTRQYNVIIKSVQIPSHLVTRAEEIRQLIKSALCHAYPKCEVLLLRSHSLKIKNRLYSDQNDILICVYGGYTEKKGLKVLKVKNIVNALRKYEKIPGFKKSAAKTISNEVDLGKKAGQRFELVDRHLSSPSAFHLFTDFYFNVEAQLNRLFNYMCQLDLRCYPVISLLHYFCTINNCYFDDPKIQGEPMEWLVILFMSNKKIIPTVREILNQNHDPMWHNSAKRRIDIGFSSNNHTFVRNWKNMHRNDKKMIMYKSCDPESVLKLFQEFMSFMGNVLGNGNLILNVRDGEVLNRNLLFWGKRREVTLNTNLTEEEIKAIAKSQDHKAEWGTWPFSIVNPLVVHSKLGFQAENVFKAMKLMKFGADQLEKYLEVMGK